jgi:hypothetical protein
MSVTTFSGNFDSDKSVAHQPKEFKTKVTEEDSDVTQDEKD